MKDPRLAAALVAWIESRCPSLNGLVFPMSSPPSPVGPYCTYTFIDRIPVTSLGGLSGLTMRRIQIDVWDTDDVRGSALGFKIIGTQADPGLDQLQDVWSYPAIGDIAAGEFAVEYVEAQSPIETYEPPADGTENGWYRYSCDFLFNYVEG